LGKPGSPWPNRGPFLKFSLKCKKRKVIPEKPHIPRTVPEKNVRFFCARLGCSKSDRPPVGQEGRSVFAAGRSVRQQIHVTGIQKKIKIHTSKKP